MKKIVFVMICMLLLVGCNTWRGFGQDLEEAGEAIQKKADD